MIERVTSKDEYDALLKQSRRLLSFNITALSGSNSLLTQVDSIEQVSPVAANLLGYMSDSNVSENALLFGSTLRNFFLNDMHDMDFSAEDVDICIPFQHDYSSKDQTAEGHLKSIIDKLKQHPNLTDVDYIKEHHLSEGMANYNFVKDRIKCTFVADDGLETNVDISITDNPKQVLALGGDAPINSITMSQQGKIEAHPYFHDHAQALWYASLVNDERAAVRFDHLLGQIPNLKNVGPFYDLPEVSAARQRNMEQLEVISARIELANAEEYGLISKHPSKKFKAAVNEGQVDVPKILGAIRHRLAEHERVDGTTRRFLELHEVNPMHNPAGVITCFTNLLRNTVGASAPDFYAG